MKNLRRILFISILSLAGASGMNAQSGRNANENETNFFTMRDRYKSHLKVDEEKESKRENEKKRKGKKEGEKEDMAFEEYQRWEYYWKDRLEISPGKEKDGQMANIGEYMQMYARQNGANVTFPEDQSNLKNSGNPNTAGISSPICNTGANWTCMGPYYSSVPILGRVISLYVDPSNANHIYAGANGLFETVNNGATWNCLTDASRMPTGIINTIAVDPTNPLNIYIGGSFESPGNSFVANGRGSYGFGVLKSTDGGINWTEIFTLSTYTGSAITGNVKAIKIHPQDPNSIYVLGEGKVFYGNGTGTSYTWTNVWSSPPPPPTPVGNNIYYEPNDIEIIPGTSGVSNSKVMFSTLMSDWIMNTYITPWRSARVFVATDGGTTTTSFNEITSTLMGTDECERYAIAVQPGNNNDFFLAYGSLASNTAYLKQWNVSSGSVTSTSSCGNPGYGFWNVELEFSKNDPNVFYMGCTEMHRYSLSGGGLAGTDVTFSSYYATLFCLPNSNTHADIRCVKVSTSGLNDVLLIGDDGGTQKAVFNPTTQTTMPTWQNLCTQLALNQFFWIAGNENKPYELVGGLQDNGTTEYYSSVWNERTDGDGYRGVINPSTNQYYGFFNGGAKGAIGTGTCYGAATVPGGGYGGNRPIAIDPLNPSRLYTTGLSGANWTVYISDNFGTTWYTMPGFLATPRYIKCIRVAQDNPNVVYVIKEGTTWGPLTDVIMCCTYTTSWACVDQENGTYTSPLGLIAWASITDLAIDPLNSQHIFAPMNGFSAQSYGSMVGVGRVFESTDGGHNWNDITCTSGGPSKSLTPFPVMSIVYQGGTSDVLYVGTDVGVWRYNKNATGGPGWECFNYGLPIVPVTCLEINHCVNKIRVATYGRGVWESALPPINTNNQLVVNASTTWSFDRRLTSDVFVTGNCNLTISKTVYMATGKKFIIDKGSTLTVTGTGKITNCCGELWLGIEVWGTPGSSQSTAGAQGKVVLQSGSTIENCNEGIVTAKNLGGTLDMTYTGGLIQALGANFINNKRSAALYPYQYSIANNLSYFKACTFETNQLIAGGVIMPDVHLKLNGVKNVMLQGNHFRNTLPVTTYNVIFRGTGISSLDSPYTVDDYGTTSSSTFEDVYAGIVANFTPGVVKNVFITNSDFNDIQHSVEINYSYSSTISNNTITSIPAGQSSSFSDATWGIRVNNVTNFYATGNTLFGAATFNSYGVIVDNCGSNASLVGTNTFRTLSAGIQAQGNNGSGTGAGVQFKCNTFLWSIVNRISVCPVTPGSIANQGSACSLSNTRYNDFSYAASACEAINVGTGTTLNYYASTSDPTSFSCGATITWCSSVSGECSGGGGGGTGRVSLDSLSVDEVIAELKRAGTNESKVSLVGIYINEGRYTEATQLLDLLKREKGMQDVVAYFEILFQMSRSGSHELSTENVSTMEKIASGKSYVALSAKIMLSELKGVPYERITEHFPQQDAVSVNNSEKKQSFLSDNVPNPFDNSTIIHCTVQEDVDNATLQITTIEGKIMKTISLVKGENVVTFEASDLNSGIYFYSLLIDGKRIETKRMVIIRD